LIIAIASLAPLTFSAAIAGKGASSAAAEAIPNISKKIPMITIIKTTISPTNHVTWFNIDDEITEKIAANTNVITAIVKLNFSEWLSLGFITYLISYVSFGMVIYKVKTAARSEEHTSELQSRFDLVCRLLLEKKNLNKIELRPVMPHYYLPF